MAFLDLWNLKVHLFIFKEFLNIFSPEAQKIKKYFYIINHIIKKRENATHHTKRKWRYEKEEESFTPSSISPSSRQFLITVLLIISTFSSTILHEQPKRNRSSQIQLLVFSVLCVFPKEILSRLAFQQF